MHQGAIQVLRNADWGRGGGVADGGGGCQIFWKKVTKV